METWQKCSSERDGVRRLMSLHVSDKKHHIAAYRDTADIETCRLERDRVVFYERYITTHESVRNEQPALIRQTQQPAQRPDTSKYDDVVPPRVQEDKERERCRLRGGGGGGGVEVGGEGILSLSPITSDTVLTVCTVCSFTQLSPLVQFTSSVKSPPISHLVVCHHTHTHTHTHTHSSSQPVETDMQRRVSLFITGGGANSSIKVSHDISVSLLEIND